MTVVLRMLYASFSIARRLLCLRSASAYRRGSRRFSLRLLFLHTLDFGVATVIAPAILGQLKELIQNGLYLGYMLAHADQPRDFRSRRRQWSFAQVVQVKHAPVCKVFKRLQVGRVGGVVAQVEWVVVNNRLR